MTLQMFKLVVPQLKKQSLATIKKFMADLRNQKVQLPADVVSAFDAIVNEKLKEELKRRKTNAMYLY